ncbi:AsnC family protein, partial [Francisella tularensis]|nr:AsnC family protein [Francisella tularensis]
MIDKSEKIDDFDLKILTCLQRNAVASQRDLADQVGLSQNACWRR